MSASGTNGGAVLGTDPAHPCTAAAYQYCGLTKRELFAAMVFQALVQVGAGCNPGIAKESVIGADHLLAALSEPQA